MITSFFLTYFYIRVLKKIITIFLLGIISISHLNIIDTLIDINTKYKKENTSLFKNLPASEESDTEKENDGKSKEEKFITDLIGYQEDLRILNRNNFNLYKLPLIIDPYPDHEIHPPQAV